MFSVSKDDSSDPTSADSDSDDNESPNVLVLEAKNVHLGASSSYGSNCRTKRDLSWCDVETDYGRPQTSASYTSPSYTSSHNFGNPTTNPTFGNRMQLYSRTHHFLAVYPDGRVRGTKDRNDLHTHLELIGVGFPGHLLIKGLLTNLYVSMNARGRPIAQPNLTDDRAVFVETIHGFYIAYLSRHYAHEGWYLAIKRSGKMKNGKKTRLNQKAVQYVKQRKHFQ